MVSYHTNKKNVHAYFLFRWLLFTIYYGIEMELGDFLPALLCE